MTPDRANLPDVLSYSPVQVVFGSGTLPQLGERARAAGAHRVLLITDPGIMRAGHAADGLQALQAAQLDVFLFDGVVENPSTTEVAAGVHIARTHDIDFIVAIGGGSSMDCAKGINLILTNGGEVADYWGVDLNQQPMLPMIAVPTTAGTGSEAQSFALLTDPSTHRKMACGVRAVPTEGGLRPRVAILDPDLTASQPPRVARACGIDAVAHAIESSGCTKRNHISRAFSKEAWAVLEPSFPTSILDQRQEMVRANMLLGAHLAGAAIEHSMLGAAHSCANPLTARYGTVHGVAVGLMLPHVIRFNAEAGDNPYVDLVADASELAGIVEHMLEIAELPSRLSEISVPGEAVGELAALAAREWTAKFNPRPVDEKELKELYQRAL